MKRVQNNKGKKVPKKDPKVKSNVAKNLKRGSRVYNSDVLGKGLVMKSVVIPCIMVLIATMGFLFWYNVHHNNVESQVAYIKQYYKNGVINDWQGKLNCESIEDIKWFRNNKVTEIDFGSIVMEWDNDKFLTKSNLELINQIGFTVKLTKDKKDIVLFWCGQEVERWIK